MVTPPEPDRDDETSWELLWGQMHELYEIECERTERLRQSLRDLGDSLDKIGETRLAKVARARAADA